MIADYLVGKVGVFILRILVAPGEAEKSAEWKKLAQKAWSHHHQLDMEHIQRIHVYFFWGYPNIPNPFLRKSCERHISTHQMCPPAMWLAGQPDAILPRTIW